MINKIEKQLIIKIIIPMFNDWGGFSKIIDEIELIFKNSNHYLEIILVNDCSTIKENIKQKNKLKLTVINLLKNSGSQKAISIGLKYINENYEKLDYIFIMDSDGEDMPKDLPNLLKHAINTNNIVFARRVKRNENILFKFFYFLYKFVFKLLTGKVIDFGNFSCLPSHYLRKIIYTDNLDLHFAASIAKSNLNYETIDCSKGLRHYGSTKLSLQKHFLHGLISLSIFLENIAVKIFFSSFLSMIVVILLSFFVFIAKFLFSQTLLGWSSIILLSLFILFVTFLLICLISLSILLNRNTYISQNSINLDKATISSIEVYE